MDTTSGFSYRQILRGRTSASALLKFNLIHIMMCCARAMLNLNKWVRCLLFVIMNKWFVWFLRRTYFLFYNRTENRNKTMAWRAAYIHIQFRFGINHNHGESQNDQIRYLRHAESGRIWIFWRNWHHFSLVHVWLSSLIPTCLLLLLACPHKMKRRDFRMLRACLNMACGAITCTNSTQI